MRQRGIHDRAEKTKPRSVRSKHPWEEVADERNITARGPINPDRRRKTAVLPAALPGPGPNSVPGEQTTMENHWVGIGEEKWNRSGPTFSFLIRDSCVPLYLVKRCSVHESQNHIFICLCQRRKEENFGSGQ